MGLDHPAKSKTASRKSLRRISVEEILLFSHLKEGNILELKGTGLVETLMLNTGFST